jgi:hypothetical protein
MNAIGLCRHNNLGNYCPACALQKGTLGSFGDDSALSSVLSTVEGAAATSAENSACSTLMNYYTTNPALAYTITAAIAIFAIYGMMRMLEAAMTCEKKTATA